MDIPLELSLNGFAYLKRNESDKKEKKQMAIQKHMIFSLSIFHLFALQHSLQPMDGLYVISSNFNVYQFLWIDNIFSLAVWA